MVDLPLDRARERLDIWQVWDATTLDRPDLKRWGRDGVVSSPFRPDANASFSVGKDGRVFYDHAERSGGDVIDFIKRAFGLDFRDARAKALEIAGIEDDPERPRESLSKAERQRRAVERRNRASREAYERMRDLVERRPEAPEIEVWPDAVVGRWVEGRSHLLRAPSKRRQLAEMRGWPVEWVEGLMEAGLVSLPVMAKWEISEGAPRGWAFKVEAPVNGDLLPLGYHQYTPFKDRESGKVKKMWQYFPNTKEKERPSAYQSALMLLGRALPSVPFAIGNFGDPEVVCILEGQWDAITYFGHVGGFEGVAGNVLALGVRGVGSQEHLLSLWGGVMEGRKVVMVPQSDVRGLSWIRRERDGLGPEVPCFADRVRAIAGELVVKDMPREDMDFNDWYRERTI